MKATQSTPGNSSRQIAIGVVYLLLGLGQLIVNWEKIVWNAPLIIISGFFMLGIFYVLTGVEAKLRKHKHDEQKNES